MGRGHTHALHVHGHSPVHRAPPEVKVAAAFAFVVAVAVTPREAVWAFAVDASLLVAMIRVARLPARFVATRAVVVAPFLLLAATIPFVASGERIALFGGVEVSREGLWGAWNIVAKSLLGVTVSVVLAGTTEVTRILTGLQRLHVPATFTAIATFMIRYLEILAAEVRRMRTAMSARGYAPRWLWQARPVATSAGALFVRSYERGERVHAAMLARGFDGVMPELDEGRATGRDWLRGACIAVVPVVAAVVALVTT